MKIVYAPRRISAIVQGDAILVAVVGIVAIIGHLNNIPIATNWGTDTVMAPNTAICFIATAVAMWALSSVVERMGISLDHLPCKGEHEIQHSILSRLDEIEKKLVELTKQ